jgi:hypothetical protein
MEEMLRRILLNLDGKMHFPAAGKALEGENVALFSPLE